MSITQGMIYRRGAEGAQRKELGGERFVAEKILFYVADGIVKGLGRVAWPETKFPLGF